METSLYGSLYSGMCAMQVPAMQPLLMIYRVNENDLRQDISLLKTLLVFPSPAVKAAKIEKTGKHSAI